MPVGGNPNESGSNEERIAELERLVQSLLNRGVWLAGDYLDSEQAPPEFLAGVLSDGGRPGWWLANGATYVQADDPDLKNVLNGASALPDYRGRVRVAPNGATFLARGTLVGAESASVPSHTHSTPAHSHGMTNGTISGAPGVTTAGISYAGGGTPATFVTAVTAGTLDTAGSTANEGGGTTGSGGGGSVSSIQPTRTIGATWIKR